MPSVLCKLKKGNPEDQVPQLGLIPEDDVVHGHCPYDSKSLHLSLEGHVSTPAGLFLQMLSKDMVSAVGGEDVPIPSGLGVEDDMDGSDDEPAEVLAAREARAE